MCKYIDDMTKTYVKYISRCKSFIYVSQIHEYIDGLVQERRNSSALAQSHRYTTVLSL